MVVHVLFESIGSVGTYFKIRCKLLKGIWLGYSTGNFSRYYARVWNSMDDENTKVGVDNVERGIGEALTANSNREAPSESDYVGRGKQLTTKRKKDRPNFFVSIPILNAQTKERVLEIQNRIEEDESKFKSVMISIPTLHLSLNILSLKSEEQIISAKKAMDEAKNKILMFTDAFPLRINVSGVGSFSNQVLFAKIASSQELNIIAEIVELISQSFEENGLKASDKKSFEAHVTILKLSRERQPSRIKALKKLIPDLRIKFENEEFGEEIVDRIDLCEMNTEKGPDGYYKIHHQLMFRETPPEVQNTCSEAESTS